MDSLKPLYHAHLKKNSKAFIWTLALGDERQDEANFLQMQLTNS